jgi:hypothetical protein
MINLVFKYKFAILVSVTLCVGIGASQSPKGVKKPMNNYEKCNYWQAQVDPSINLPKDTNEASKKDLPSMFEIGEGEATKVLEATECLLKLKGKTSPSVYSSATIGFSISTRFPPPTVEVVALYYISALYHMKWRHANGIILTDKEGRKNTQKSIEVAYKAYEAWFEKVKKIGLQKAREEKLEPLANSGISWY